MTCCTPAGSAAAFDGGRATGGSATFTGTPSQTLVLDAVDFDTDSYFNLAANNKRLTVASAGKYLIGFQCDLDTSLATVTESDCRAELSGLGSHAPAASEKVRSTSVSPAQVELSAAGLLSIAAGAVVTLVVTISGGWTGTITLSGALWIQKVG